MIQWMCKIPALNRSPIVHATFNEIQNVCLPFCRFLIRWWPLCNVDRLHVYGQKMNETAKRKLRKLRRVGSILLFDFHIFLTFLTACLSPPCPSQRRWSQTWPDTSWMQLLAPFWQSWMPDWTSRSSNPRLVTKQLGDSSVVKQFGATGKEWTQMPKRSPLICLQIWQGNHKMGMYT